MKPSRQLARWKKPSCWKSLTITGLGNPSTHVPIKFTVDIVGSTSTLVSEQIEQSRPERATAAGRHAAGGPAFRYPDPDLSHHNRAGQEAAERLARWAFVGGSALVNETDRIVMGKKVLSASAGLGTREPQDVVSSDMKVYSAGGYHFAIAQAEVSDLYEVSERLNDLRQSIE